MFFLYIIIYTVLQLFNKVSIGAVIESFTNIRFTELLGDNINLLTNVITLDLGVHQYFGELKLWFEAVPVRFAFLCDMGCN
jgi:hypothetical protein